jgi:hypothetical protein
MESQRTRPTAEAVPLEVVRDDDSSLEVKVGRKRKLTPAIFEKIMAAIDEGARITPACREHGISPKTVFMRVGRDPEAARRFTQAKQVRLQKWHEEWLGEMLEHAKRSPWATAWLLERNFPELYALREFTRAVTAGSGQPIGDKIDEDQLRRYAAQMEDFRRETEAKARKQTAALTSSENAAGIE